MDQNPEPVGQNPDQSPENPGRDLGRNPGRDPRAGLIALNVALVAILGAVTLTPATGDQPVARGRGEYLIVGSKYLGSPSSALIILDTLNQEMVAMGWDESRQEFNPLGYRNLDEDARAQPQATPGGGRK